MSCTKYLEMISASLDGELAPEENAELARHLASCPVCAERWQSFRILKHAVARLEGEVSPPKGIRARIETGHFRMPRRRWHRWFGLAITLAVAVLVVLILSRPERGLEAPSSFSRELIADHLRYVPEAMPAEVASEDRGEIHRFFAGQVPFEPVVPVLKSAQLLGGRVCTIAGRKTQLLFYEHKNRKLSLYVSDQPLAAASCDSAKDHHVCGARHGPLSLTLVGAVPREELLTLLEGADF